MCISYEYFVDVRKSFKFTITLNNQQNVCTYGFLFDLEIVWHLNVPTYLKYVLIIAVSAEWYSSYEKIVKILKYNVLKLDDVRGVILFLLKN